MKALRFYAPEDVRLEDVPEPDCGPDEVKIRVRNCSTCGTDVKIFHNGHQNLTPPRTIGHEIAGEIVEVGADVNATYGSDWKAGDRVCPIFTQGWFEGPYNAAKAGTTRRWIVLAPRDDDGSNHDPSAGTKQVIISLP